MGITRQPSRENEINRGGYQGKNILIYTIIIIEIYYLKVKRELTVFDFYSNIKDHWNRFKIAKNASRSTGK